MRTRSTVVVPSFGANIFNGRTSIDGTLRSALYRHKSTYGD